MHKIAYGLGLFLLPALAWIAAVPAGAQAAPQALGLVATQGSTPLVCENGHCSAEFSSFCLQQDRTSPAEGTIYRLAGNGAITVAGVTSDGRTVTLDPETDLRFQSLRTHVAVRIAVDAATRERLDLVSVSVTVGEQVALAPQPVAGDTNPQDEVSIAAAVGPLREIGSRIVDTNTERMAAARLTSRLINDLDANPLPRRDVAQSLWQRAVGTETQATAAAQRLAKGALNLCQFSVERRGIGEIKGCLQQHHDKFVDYLNTRYWKAVGAGT